MYTNLGWMDAGWMDAGTLYTWIMHMRESISSTCSNEKAYQVLVVMGVCSRFKFLSNGYLKV